MAINSFWKNEAFINAALAAESLHLFNSTHHNMFNEVPFEGSILGHSFEVSPHTKPVDHGGYHSIQSDALLTPAENTALSSLSEPKNYRKHDHEQYRNIYDR